MKKVFNCADIFFSYIHENDTICTHRAFAHLLIYVASGELILTEQGKDITVNAGECVFIRRDHRVSLLKRPKDKEVFKGITLMFTRPFLKEYFQKIDRKYKPMETSQAGASVRKLPYSTDLQSIFISLIPYFDAEEKPLDAIVNLKMQEGILALLHLDASVYPILFDFVEPWKIDILQFLNENYMYELTTAEMATYTGRSLATFKRDFKKISELTPEKWLINKRLEMAHELVCEGRMKVADVCNAVGFKNRSHFTESFKQKYGYTPSKA